MLRSDGTASFAFIQHREPEGDRWATSDIGHFLFASLSFAERQEHGDRLRALIAPQAAGSDLWQKYGINGFALSEDADACLVAMVAQHPDRDFRIVWRTITQSTVVVIESLR